MTKPLVISVSRRTDIPAYYADWFRKRLELGFTVYPNPVAPKPVFVDLSPQAVRAFVFWTRNPKPLFKHLDFIDEKFEKRHYMHFTINGLPERLEERNPKIDFAVSSAEYLAHRYGTDYLQWRFDPIVLSSISSEQYIIDQFSVIAGKLNGIVKRCYFSFVDLYDKTKRNFKKLTDYSGINFYPAGYEQQIKMVKTMIKIAEIYNIELYACAEDQLLEELPSVKKAHCVDAEIIMKMTQGINTKFKPEPSRIGCGCIESRDIGYYDSCPHGCIYCYANMDPDTANKNAKNYLNNGFPLDDLSKPEKESKDQLEINI